MFEKVRKNVRKSGRKNVREVFEKFNGIFFKNVSITISYDRNISNQVSLLKTTILAYIFVTFRKKVIF
jgi:hypothetical protein